MDSLTQIVLGGTVAAVAVPGAHRRRAAVAGALLATLPDLDSLPMKWLGADVVTLVTWHRGPSHSLPVLLLIGWLVWCVLRACWAPVRAAPARWLAAIWLTLLTHPLLDAFTVYGTQLWWPWPTPPVMWSSIFIIDPGYTLALLVAFIAILVVGARPVGLRFLVAGLTLSSAYLGWSLLAKHRVERAAHEALAAMGQADAPRFSVPMPFNTVLWRVVVMTPQGMLEGYRSLWADSGMMRFAPHAGDTAALQSLASTPPVARLLWFSRGFMKAQAEHNQLVLSDLRMGMEPAYTFQYAIAERASADAPWQAITPVAVTRPVDPAPALRASWQRLLHEPPPDAPPFSFTSVLSPVSEKPQP
jgi:inner membrane protein